MRRLVFSMWTAAVILGSQPATRPEDILRQSTDREALERAASGLAGSGHLEDVALLGQFLKNADFLARLDDLRNEQTSHLSGVMQALREHPSPQVAELCLALAADPAFVGVDDRKGLLLDVLAAVKPMSEATAGLFRESNEEGYFAYNAALLSRNGSPRAMALFESMMLDHAVDAGSRVECLHYAIVPRRFDPAILRAAGAILSRTSERAIAAAVIESVFDYNPRWFGIESRISRPPAWSRAPADAAGLAAGLADKALARRDLSSALREKVRMQRAEMAH